MVDFEADTSALEEFGEAGVRVIRRAVELTAVDLWGNVQEEAPKITTRLAGSWFLEQRGEDWIIATNVHYAPYVHEGTDPYTIEPVSARALRFEIAGDVIFAKRVEHPGISANPFTDRAVQRTEARLQEFAEIAVQEEGLQ